MYFTTSIYFILYNLLCGVKEGIKALPMNGVYHVPDGKDHELILLDSQGKALCFTSSVNCDLAISTNCQS